MRNVTIKKTIKCDLTADQWELYTHCEDLQPTACALVAEKLNRSVEFFLNNYPKDEARKHMTKLMEQYSEVGAADSEPFGILADLLELFYDEK
jgi:hypothetical protein